MGELSKLVKVSTLKSIMNHLVRMEDLAWDPSNPFKSVQELVCLLALIEVENRKAAMIIDSLLPKKARSKREPFKDDPDL